jgi:hypothetical protein
METTLVATSEGRHGPTERKALDQELIRLERAIRESDGGGLKLRWQMGREMLKLRVGRRLPNGVLDLLSQGLHVHPSELVARMKFAQKFSTEDQLTNVISKFTTWYDIKQHVLTDIPRGKKRYAGTPIRRTLAAFKHLAANRVAYLPVEKRLLRELRDIIDDMLTWDDTGLRPGWDAPASADLGMSAGF